ncbi:MAG: hypothetical protein KatS3mg108_0177 [Isosphaeraceae bacterium]|jgi:hypothetical protein|nr:MAG: hypothetical protein KatS3mg108_0177 [Isosphaeraceae bacterium]
MSRAALEALAKMVREAEARARSSRLEAEVRQTIDAMRAAEADHQAAESILRERKPELEKTLAQLADDERSLKELTLKITQLNATLSDDQRHAFESQIETCRTEIERERTAAKTELDTLTRAAGEARVRLTAAVDAYHAARIELERIRPEALAQFRDGESLARYAESLTPAGQLRALAREVDDALNSFGLLDRREQYHQLALWIGRQRRLQSLPPEELGPDASTTLQQIFHRLIGLSKQYEPGHIDAFRREFQTDWDQFIAEHEQGLRRAIETVRQRRETERRRAEQQTLIQDRRQQSQEAAREALDELRFLTARGELAEGSPELDAFLDALDRALAGLAPSDPELLELVRPHADHLTGGSYRALRKHLARLEQDDARTREEEAFRDSIRDVRDRTRGLRCVIIGGSPREERRRKLESLLELAELDWEPHEDKRPAALESLRERVRGGSVDLVLIIKTLVGHTVTETLRPACDDADIPCVHVDGYGEQAIAEALRRILITRQADSSPPPT